MILRAVVTRMDWQVPLALAPLRERLGALGAMQVPVILEKGPEAFLSLCTEAGEVLRGDQKGLLMQLKTWSSIPEA